MQDVLIAAVVVVAAAALYVALTFSRRTRQTTAPLLDEAVTALREQLRATADDLRRQLRVITEDLHRGREEQRLDDRKIQGRLDQADSQILNLSRRMQAELEAIRRQGEQLLAAHTAVPPEGARDDQPAARDDQPAARDDMPAARDESPDVSRGPATASSAGTGPALPRRLSAFGDPLPGPRRPGEPEG